MFTAYFDASKNSSAITMAGFVATVEEWERLEVEWRALLPAGISMFHMTDFASSKGQWKAWKGQSSRRAALVENLVKCARTHTRKGFAVTLQFKDYDEVNAIYNLRETIGQPYAFVGVACVGGLKAWAIKKGIDFREILCIFEDGDDGQGELLARLRSQGFNAIPQSKATIRAFDACDLAAWRTRVNVDDGVVRRLQDTDKQAERRILAAIDQIETATQSNGTYSFPTIRNACTLLGGKRRSEWQPVA